MYSLSHLKPVISLYYVFFLLSKEVKLHFKQKIRKKNRMYVLKKIFERKEKKPEKRKETERRNNKKTCLGQTKESE